MKGYKSAKEERSYNLIEIKVNVFSHNYLNCEDKTPLWIKADTLSGEITAGMIKKGHFWGKSAFDYPNNSEYMMRTTMFNSAQV